MFPSSQRGQRDFAGAEQWYRESLALKENQSNEPDAARTYEQLEIFAGSRERFEVAEQWFVKTIRIPARGK